MLRYVKNSVKLVRRNAAFVVPTKVRGDIDLEQKKEDSVKLRQFNLR